MKWPTGNTLDLALSRRNGNNPTLFDLSFQAMSLRYSPWSLRFRVCYQSEGRNPEPVIGARIHESQTLAMRAVLFSAMALEMRPDAGESILSPCM